MAEPRDCAVTGCVLRGAYQSAVDNYLTCIDRCDREDDDRG